MNLPIEMEDGAAVAGRLAAQRGSDPKAYARIDGVASALPEHYYSQAEIAKACQSLWGTSPRVGRRLDQLHRSVQVDGRYLCVPLEERVRLERFGELNDAFIRNAVDLGCDAVDAALRVSGLGPADIDHIFFVTVTGIATPSIESRVANRLGFRPDVKRTPVFGLGCVAGAAGVARASDYVRAYPDQRALLLSVELCSLTWQRGDCSVANIIASGLFGDGAAAVVIGGSRSRAKRPRRGAGADIGPRILGSASVLYPDTASTMGWDVGEDGFRVVLTAEVPQIVRRHLRSDVDRFLAQHGLTISDLDSFVCHPGGPKVLTALQESLELSYADVAGSWRKLRELGNVSSASVLMVLDDTIRECRPRAGSLGLMMGMGPGFCSELVLLEW